MGFKTVVTDLAYMRPSDVPKPLQDMLKQAHESGLECHQLAMVYEMPVEWIEQFCRSPRQVTH